MRGNRKQAQKPCNKLTVLLFLMLFVFVILIVSIGFAALITFYLLRTGILPPLSMPGFPALVVSLMLVSIFIGLLLTWLAGGYTLRPLRRMIQATKEIAGGNFDVRLQLQGPKEMRELAESLNDMARELCGMETLRNDFVNNVSHEFKTPVVSIRGFSKLLKRDSLTKEQRDDYLDTIISESERLTRLSSNVLLLSKLESTEKIMEIEPYWLDEQLRQAVLTLEPQISKKNLETDIHLEVAEIVANEELLRHVWMNILSNAIKFTPDHGAISIHLAKTQQDAVVTISDTGIGMDEEAQRHLFDKFYQGDPSHAAQGNGLGLALAKRILELSGGGIKAASSPGQGSVFEARIPLQLTRMA